MSQTRKKEDNKVQEIDTKDSVLADLQTRYNMDAKVWQDSKRGFPFNIPLGFIVLVALGVPIGISFILFDYQNQYLWKVYLFTIALSVVAYFVADAAIGQFKESLEKNGLFGKDLNKAGKREDKPAVPEGLGLVIAIIFLLVTIQEQVLLDFTHAKLIEYNAGLLATCMAVLLGFADDVVDLKWRHKLIVPTIATFPLLVAYNGLTSVVVPRILRPWLGGIIDLGILYQIYMGMLAVFCTNSINIYAGINGIEVGQSFIIGCFIFLHNIIEIYLGLSEQIVSQHIFSLTIIIPFLFVTMALLNHNKFPSKVFVGDTFCYFAGMTFAMVGILGHFSKTMLLFFIPQIFNFLFSCPQIFGIIHCPRHRLPKFNNETYRLECVHNHFTNINAFLRIVGPTNEQQACNTLLIVQIICCSGALFLRYVVGGLLY